MAGNRLFTSSLWNLAGGILPILFGLFLLPPTIELVGIDRFGVLTLAWVVIGYFSVFDLGLGRALTKLVAERLVSGQRDSLPGLFWTSLAMMACVGLLGTWLVFAGAGWFVSSALEVSPGLVTESLEAAWLLAAAIPVITTSAGFRGFLEAYSRFDLVNLVRIPLGISIFAGPLLAALYQPTVQAMVFSLVLARVISWFAYLGLCLWVAPALRARPRLAGSELRPLVSFGGWMTISNVVGPIMLYLDRFLIGALVSATAVAYYTTPYEVITKVLIVPAALATALFPALTQALYEDSDAARLYRVGLAAIMGLIWLPVALAGSFSQELLGLWLGEEFAANSWTIVRWLAIGVFLNAIAHIPFFFVQAAGRPDIAARVHLLELPVYILALYAALALYGVEGAAITWTLRVLVDTLLFTFLAARLHSPLRADLARLYMGLLLGLLGFVLVYWPAGIGARLLALAFVAPLIGVYTWRYFLSGDDRKIVLKHPFVAAIQRSRSTNPGAS